MIFGSTEAFAIEAMTEEGLTPESAAWGRMQVWCQGVSIGDYSDEHCGLPYTCFLELRKKLYSLWLPEFEGMSAKDLWNHLDGRVYGYLDEVEFNNVRTPEDIDRDYMKYGDFNFLTNWGEMFDRGGKSFIFCTPSGDVRVLNSVAAPERWLTAKLPDVLRAITEFLGWYEGECSRLGRPVLRTSDR